MRVLGIDPGSRLTGWGVVEDQGRDPVYLGSGTVVEHNPALRDQPFLVNSDPEGAGWLVLVDPGPPAPPGQA